MKSLISFILCSCFQFAEAQDQYIIKGKTYDSISNQSIAFATISLFGNSQPKPITNRITSENGQFEFEVRKSGLYTIIITHTSFSEKTIRLNIESAVNDLGTIFLTPKQGSLQNVVLTVRRPLIEQALDKLIYNVDADISNKGRMATDVLRKTPFVSVDPTGNILVNGRSDFKFLINGKENSAFTKNPREAIMGLPANLIRRIEIITNPSSKYDGEGVGGIINIITKSNIQGYNANIGLSYSYRNFGNSNASLNLKYGKLGILGFFSNNFGGRPEAKLIREKLILNSPTIQKITTNGTQLEKIYTNIGNIEFSYDIDSLRSISLYGDTKGGNRTHTDDLAYLIFQLPGQTDNFSYSDKDRLEFPTSNAGISYSKKFKRNKRKELVFRNYNEFSQANSIGRSTLTKTGFYRLNENNNKGKNREHTFQADYTIPISQKATFETGIKTILRRVSSDYENLVSYSRDVKPVLDSTNTNKLTYHQEVYGAYTSFSFPIKKTSFKIGIRVEQTNVNGHFNSGINSIKQDYFTFLPSVFMSHIFTNSQSAGFSFGKRIYRPSITSLNPFVNTIDSLTFQYGNPALHAEKVYTLEIGYNYNNQMFVFNIKVNYSFSTTEIIEYSVFDAIRGITITTNGNGGKRNAFGINANINLRPGQKWSIISGCNFNYIKLINQFLPWQKNEALGGTARLGINYKVNDKFYLNQFNFFYQGPAILQGIGRNGRSFFYTIGANYSLLRDKVSLAFSAQNIFKDYIKFDFQTKDISFLNNFQLLTFQRILTLSVNYNFGLLKENLSRKKQVSNEDLK